MLRRFLSDKRLKNASLTTIMNMLNQAVTILTSLISIPIILNYVGTEQFALWMVLTTALSFISFSDFGIGIGVQDAISRHFAKGQNEEIKKIFSTSLSILIVISLLFIFLFFILFYFIESSKIYYSVVLIFTLGIVAGLITRIFSAIQKGFIIAFVQLISRCIAFSLLFVFVYHKVDFSIIVFLIGGTSYLFVILFGLPFLFFFNRNIFSFSFKSIDIYHFKGVLNIGILGLFASISMYLINNTLPFLLSIKYSAHVISNFAIAYKIISLPVMVVSFVFIPLWPAITEAYMKKDYIWINNIIKKMFKIFLFLSFISFISLYLTMQKLVEYWLSNESIYIDNTMLLLMLFFMLVSFWNSYLTTILNGFSQYKSQAIVGLFLSAISFLAAYISIKLFYFEYYYLILIILFGYFLRCLYMSIEIKIKIAAIKG